MKQGGEGCELCFRVKGVKSSMLISTNSNITKFGAVKVLAHFVRYVIFRCGGV